jgi:hypothetical protein
MTRVSPKLDLVYLPVLSYHDNPSVLKAPLPVRSKDLFTVLKDLSAITLGFKSNLKLFILLVTAQLVHVAPLRRRALTEQVGCL